MLSDADGECLKADSEQHFIVLRDAEYDVYSVKRFEAELASLSSNSVVDFRNVRYIDSTCLSALIRTLKRLRTQDEAATLTLLNLIPSIRGIFEITHLAAIFEIP